MRIWEGVPLGYQDGKPLANPGPAPTCWLGQPGSGKTADGTINLLLDEPGEQSFLVFDSKCTVYAVTHEYRRKVCGTKNVMRANPENVLGMGSDGFNPAKLDPKAADFEDRAQLLASAAIPETNDHQKHFTFAARSATTAGIVDEVKEAARANRTPSLPKVRALWTQDPKMLKETVRRMMKSGDPAITMRVAKFLDDTDELDNIKSTIEAASTWMTASMIADMETSDGIDFDALRERPTTIYATLPTESLVDKGTYFRLLLASALGQLYRKPGLKTTIIIEEGFVCGRLEILEMAFATGRELGIDIVIVFQSVSQIKQLYPAQWKTFLSGAVLAYRAGESDTAGWMSERAGKELVPMPSVSEPSGPNDQGGPRRSYSLQWCERIPAGSMYAMPKGTALVWLPGDDAPRIVHTRGYYAIPKLASRASRNPYVKTGEVVVGRRLVRLAAVAVMGAVIALLTVPRTVAVHNLQSWLPDGLLSYVTDKAPTPSVVTARRGARP